MVVVHGFWGKRMPLCGRNSPDSTCRTVVLYQSFEVVLLLVGDDGPEVRHLDRALADEDDLGDGIHPGYPRVANQLRVQCGYTVRLVRGYRAEKVFHSSTQDVPSSSPMASDEGDKAAAERKVRVN